MRQVSANTLLNHLPPYRDEWVTIHPDQSVKDIMKEVLNAHEEFAPYYDKISLYFDADTTEAICKNIYSFLSANVQYDEEPEESQTSAIPTGILTRGHGDCKHYAGFSAGVLDSIRRLTGKRIDWNYRFASYKYFDKTPHHVFVSVKDGDTEIWIDPTPGANEKQPVWTVDKSVKVSSAKNISGIDDDDSIGEMLCNDEYELFMQMSSADQDNVIGGFFDGLWHGTKKVTLAVPRNAYLSLVALNVFGLASKLKQAISQEDGKRKLSDKWYSLGGNPDKLINAINAGANKSRILGINSIGNPAVPAWVAAATAIIAAMTPLLKSILTQQQSSGYGMVEGYDPSLLNTADMSAQDTGILGWIKSHPMESIAIGAAAFLLINEFVLPKKLF